MVLGIFGFAQHPDRCFLQVAIVVRGLLQAELNRAGGDVAVCRAGLRQGIDFGGIAVPGKVVGKMQLTNHMGRVAALPAIHHIAVPIGHGQSGTGQGKGIVGIGGESALVDLYGGLLVGVQAVNNLACDKLVFVGELNRNHALLDQVTVRHADLTQIVAAAVGRPVVGIAAAVMFAAQGNIHVKIGETVFIGSGCPQQRIGGCQQLTGNTVNVVCGIQLIDSPRDHLGISRNVSTVAATVQEGGAGLAAICIGLFISQVAGVAV